MSKSQNGFTVIELIVVIVIIGILSAVAMPKMMSLIGDSKGALMEGTADAVSKADVAITGKAAIQNVDGLASATVKMDNNTYLAIAKGHVIPAYMGSAVNFDNATVGFGTAYDPAGFLGGFFYPQSVATSAAEAIRVKCYVEYMPSPDQYAPSKVMVVKTGC